MADVLMPKVPRVRERRRRTRPRSKTISAKSLTRKSLTLFELLDTVDASGEVLDVSSIARPVTRGECRGEERPCPWVACKHHLYLDVNPESGSIKINFPDLEPWELVESCALDVAERGEQTLEEVGRFTNLTRERIRQVEVRGLIALKFSAAGEELAPHHVPPPKETT